MAESDYSWERKKKGWGGLRAIVIVLILAWGAYLFWKPGVFSAQDDDDARQTRQTMQALFRAVDAYWQKHHTLGAWDTVALMEALRKEPASQEILTSLPNSVCTGNEILDGYNRPMAIRAIGGYISNCTIVSLGPDGVASEDDIAMETQWTGTATGPASRPATAPASGPATQAAPTGLVVERTSDESSGVQRQPAPGREHVAPDSRPVRAP